jgi:hypothetical protein
MNRLEFLTYKGKRILLIDFSHLKAEQVLLVIDEAKGVIARQPERSVLTLTDLTEMHFDENIMAALKEYVTHNKPYVKAGAVVGAKGLLAVVKMGVERASLRKLTDFDSRAAAQEWLIQQ